MHSLHYKAKKEKLDKVGCGFCLAKWTQVTLHLHIGHNHSCHHPQTHRISEQEIKRNPSALHNTNHKKLLRKEMKEGKRPTECGYCWNVEDNTNEYSDRVFKSSDTWSWPQFEEIKDLDWRANFNPRYVEVAFSNTCNFKCSYCAPAFSTQWMEEIEKFGGYPTTTDFNSLKHFTDRIPFKHSEHNPYVEAFWEWWPELYRDLHTFRITGGEPLLAKDTWKVLDYIIEQDSPNTNLNLAINTNLGVPDNLIERFIEKLKIIEERNLVKTLTIYTSCDTHGKQAEYIRNGLNYEKFIDNINKLMTNCKKTTISIMCTYNALSVPNFGLSIEEVINLKKKYHSTERYTHHCVFLDISYLRHPLHQTVKVLPQYWSRYIKQQIELMESHSDLGDPAVTQGFSDMEIIKLKRIYEWFVTKNESVDTIQNYKLHINDFYKFMIEHDIRRNTNFTETFPEFESYFNSIPQLTDDWIDIHILPKSEKTTPIIKLI